MTLGSRSDTAGTVAARGVLRTSVSTIRPMLAPAVDAPGRGAQQPRPEPLFQPPDPLFELGDVFLETRQVALADRRAFDGIGRVVHDVRRPKRHRSRR